MSINEDAINAIQKSIALYFNIQKDKLFFDKTHPGLISGVVDSSHYKVKISGREYPNVHCCNDTVFKEHDAVWVTMPQGCWSNMFIAGRRNNG